MKKILTASLVAMMAVTAANADIASTGYVNKQTGVNESGQFVFNGDAQGKTNLAEAVNAVADKVSQLSADVGEGGAVSDQIADKVGELGNNANGQAYGTVAEAIAGAKAAAEADATAKANKALSDANSYTDTAKAAAIATAGTNADNKINALKGDMKLDTVGGENKYIASVTQTDGKVTAEEGTIDTAVTANSTNLVTSGAVATAIAAANGNTNTLRETVTANTSAITNINNDINDIFDDIDAISNAETGTLATTKKELEGKITAAQSAAEQTASADATSKANAALAEAKSYADTAKAGAISTAAADATSKADKALADAKADAANTYQVKSSAMSIGAAGGAWTDLTTVTGYSGTGTHSLVLKDGKIQWEAVEY